ncbi:hypothetical protein FS837_007393 [Tulasnella sp. UAMH 9824]|nr:hypothetical protein FS837_007393 [Tulasnella sp. UAMH 9824]
MLPTIKTLDSTDLHSAALVCHMWSEIALDYLWETAVSLAPLLNTLAPMHYSEEESNWTFASNLDQANWSRFQAYAQRIRIVEICSNKKRWSKPVSMDSVEIARMTVPAGYNFPRPVHLVYRGMGQHRQNPNSFILSLRNFLSVVSTSIKTLHTFEISFIDWDSDDAPVQDLFRRFAELEEASLESVSLKHRYYFSNSPAIPNLVKRHASTISSLVHDVPYTEQLWTAIQSLHNLKELYIDLESACSSPNGRRDTIIALNDITSGIFPGLELFSVQLPSTDVDVEERRLEVFKCISRLTRLTSLTMRGKTPIMPYANEMWHVGQSLCRLEKLSIDANGWGDDQTPGTSSSLLSILQSFPRIKHLSTSFICNSIPDTSHTRAHSSLEILDLGWSPGPKARQEDVVDFLRSILPRTACVVHSGGEMVFGGGGEEATWNEIIRLLGKA